MVVATANLNIYKSPYPTSEVPTDISVSQFLLQTNPDDVAPDTLILQDFDDPDQRLTYAELRRNAAYDAAGLKDKLGLREGDVVCILARNSVQWVSLAHAVLWAGGCFSGINPLATSHELVHYFTVAQPRFIAVDVELVPKVDAALRELQTSLVPKIVLVDGSSNTRAQSLIRYPNDIRNTAIEPLCPFEISLKDNTKIPAAMCFSSGTSGKPKGVVLSHHNLIAQLLGVRATNPFTHNATMREAFFPSFAHVYGIVSGVLAPAWIGNYVQPMKKFEYLPYLRRAAELKANILRLVPAAAVRMTKDPEIRQLDLSSVHTVMCSGAPLSNETVEALQRILSPKATVLNGYGMSEATLTLLRNTRGGRKGASVGKPAAGMELRVVDDNFGDVPVGTDGECLVRGPSVFMEYKNNTAETAAAFKDGWLCTGDVVRVDEEGYFWLTGRKKELIKYKGNQIAPAELEAVLLSHPAVTDAGVCGVGDKMTDEEVPVGFVCLAEVVDGKERAKVVEAIGAFVDERVSPYKRLRGGLFWIEALPKNNSGKLLRRDLVQLAERLRTPMAKL